MISPLGKAATLAYLASSAYALPSLLVFSATTGFRHESIPTAIEVLRSAASAQNVSFEFTEDAGQFTTDSLAQYDGLVFLMTSGQDVLSAEQQTAFNDYLRSGGTYMGIHSASDCLQNTAFYNQTVGAIFDYHPPIQDATFMPVTKDHPATADFPDEWRYQEEVYFFRSDPRENGATVILTVDTNSFEDNGTSTGNYPSQGDPHPIGTYLSYESEGSSADIVAWYIESPTSAEPLMDGAPKAGRSFYTSLGHLDSTWQDERFTNHIFGGLRWILEGESTRAFGVGLVGNATEAASTPSASASGPAASQSSSTSSNTQTGTMTQTSSSSSAASETSSPNSSAKVHEDMILGLLGVLILSIAGMVAVL